MLSSYYEKFILERLMMQTTLRKLIFQDEYKKLKAFCLISLQWRKEGNSSVFEKKIGRK